MYHTVDKGLFKSIIFIFFTEFWGGGVCIKIYIIILKLQVNAYLKWLFLLLSGL